MHERRYDKHAVLRPVRLLSDISDVRGACQPVSLLRMDLCAQVGENVRRHRRAAGLTQEEVAHRANLDRTYLSDIERGIRNPTVMLLQDIAAVFGVHPALLLVSEREAALIGEMLLPLGSGGPPPT